MKLEIVKIENLKGLEEYNKSVEDLNTELDTMINGFCFQLNDLGFHLEDKKEWQFGRKKVFHKEGDGILEVIENIGWWLTIFGPVRTPHKIGCSLFRDDYGKNFTIVGESAIPKAKMATDEFALFMEGKDKASITRNTKANLLRLIKHLKATEENG